MIDEYVYIYPYLWVCMNECKNMCTRPVDEDANEYFCSTCLDVKHLLKEYAGTGKLKTYLLLIGKENVDRYVDSIFARSEDLIAMKKNLDVLMTTAQEAQREIQEEVKY